ncbi:hypothetical protein NQ315_002050 [Exocentrus adspersus]|uniref:J domain-containing protein n=1 Tax=Exocentrus adspersus TaxID=1586481 RepID=A0AAV8VFN8_9CUCU|nr:hypothetical protein NQ315_002050 [Exocentrus adspersus]
MVLPLCYTLLQHPCLSISKHFSIRCVGNFDNNQNLFQDPFPRLLNNTHGNSLGNKALSSHYEILNLPRSCSTKEIKESFIRLSKEAEIFVILMVAQGEDVKNCTEERIFICSDSQAALRAISSPRTRSILVQECGDALESLARQKENHPDVNKSKDAHKRFLQINEAYKVLSKTETRQLYDLSLASPYNFSHRDEIRVQYREPFRTDPWKDPSFYINRNRAHDRKYESEPYYGIKGINRVSNLAVVIVCLTIASLVIGLQVLAIRSSVTFKRDELIRRSNAAKESLKQVRDAASINGNEMQIELLTQKFKNSSK